MKRAAKFDIGFKEINKTYWELERNKAFKERNQLYLDSFQNYSEKHLKNNGLDMNQLFNNMSIKFKALDGSPTLWFDLLGIIDNMTLPDDLIDRYKKTFDHYNYLGEPLETIVVRQFKKNLKSI